VAREGEEIAVRVSNTGRLSAEPAGHRPGCLAEGTGTGLKNIGERLRLVFPDRHSFKMWESDGWVHAEIRFRPAAQNSQDEAAHSADRG
jgi:LytS/YehU family sensor histidine kinase